jgi:ribosomal protein S12 methylthiotransferase
MRKPVRCAVVSLGCPKNLVDSENMLGWLVGSGFELTTDLEEAEVIVVNTCGFLQAAVKESLSHLRKLARLKRKGNCRVRTYAVGLRTWTG